MSKQTSIIIASLVGVGVITALAVLFIPVSSAPSAAEPKQEPAKPAQTQATKNFNFGDTASGGAAAAAATSSAAASAAAGAKSAASPKEQTLQVIHDAMTTYSAEGVPILQPLLANPDPEIRGEAVEAMKQLGVPEAVAALRTAAKANKNPEERQAMLEAAAWAELPPLIGPGAPGR
jgi:HEAT repeat protein